MLPHLFAYLDLASGSMIVQAAIAGMVAVPILLRNHIRRLVGRGSTTEDATLEQVVTSHGRSKKIFSSKVRMVASSSTARIATRGSDESAMGGDCTGPRGVPQPAPARPMLLLE